MARDTFEAALSAVLRHEGGYSDHPADPGGATMMGITLATLASWRGAPVSKDDVKALRRDEAARIYRARYWQAIAGDALPAGLDLAVFDFAVNSGPARAARTLQKQLRVEMDGRIGPVTLAAARAAPPAELIAKLCAERLGFLRRLSTFPVFGRGWTSRVRDIEQEALRLVDATPGGAPTPRNSTPSAIPTGQEPQHEEPQPMDISKTIFTSRTVWANAIGLVALGLSWFGFDTSSVDKTVLTDNLLHAMASASFVASTVFRVIATKKLV